MSIHPRPTDSLFAEPIARSHATDPDTSVKAAASMNRSGNARANLERVVQAVETNPGKTSGELEQIVPGLDLTEVRRRLTAAARPNRSGVVRIVRSAARKCRVLLTSQSTWFAAKRCKECGDWVAVCDECPCGGK